MHEPLPVFRATATREAGVVGSTMRRRAKADTPSLVRLGPNAFVRADEWAAADSRKQHVTRVHARLGHLSTPAVVSHVSAVAMHDLPWINWPEAAHITVDRRHRRSRAPGLRFHTRALGSAEVVHGHTLPVTTRMRTVIDIAMWAHHRDAIVVLDAALRLGATKDSLMDYLQASGRIRNREAATAAITFADGRAGSPLESLARVVFRELGLPHPVLQQEFVVDRQRFFVDMWFPDQGVIVELDGRVKYDDDATRNGRSTSDVFIAEKRRHELLLTVPGVRHIVRLEWRDLYDVERLVKRLTAAGLVPRLKAPSAVQIGALR